jgi:RNA recognition motif-containing protein
MSQSKLYVGNLSYSTTDSELQDFFAQYGNIQELKLIFDRETGRSRGFAFVSFTTEEETEKALAADGVDLGGRKLKVNRAKEEGAGGGARRPRPNGGRPFGGGRDFGSDKRGGDRY